MRSSTPESRLAAVTLLLLLTAGPAAASEGSRAPQAPVIDALQAPVGDLRDAVLEVRDTVRREVRAAVRSPVLGDTLRETVRAQLREQAAAVREMRQVRVEMVDVWREIVAVCPMESATAHRQDPIGRAAHALASWTKELAPKLGVLVGTGAKLLGRLVQAVQI